MNINPTDPTSMGAAFMADEDDAQVPGGSGCGCGSLPGCAIVVVLIVALIIIAAATSR